MHPDRFAPWHRWIAPWLIGVIAGLGANASEDDGFQPIFDGQSLEGWVGQTEYWSVRDGILTGEVTEATLLHENSFLVWRGGTVGDFELKVEYRISGQGNSGINYRSVDVAGVPHALQGYQADIDGGTRYTDGQRHTGNIYEERGREFLARRGDIAHTNGGGESTVLGAVGTYEGLVENIVEESWNELHIIARANTLMHILNGRVMAVFVDDDVQHGRRDGLIGVQVHRGPPMKIEYRSIRLKQW